MSFSDFAKTALTEAQKRIDKVLDINEADVAQLSSNGKYLLSIYFVHLSAVDIFQLT